MQTFSRAGLTFDVSDSGTPENGTVVLLHGFPQTSHSWRAVTPILNAQGYRTIAPDQRGYSPSLVLADVSRIASANSCPTSSR